MIHGFIVTPGTHNDTRLYSYSGYSQQYTTISYSGYLKTVHIIVIPGTHNCAYSTELITEQEPGELLIRLLTEYR